MAGGIKTQAFADISEIIKKTNIRDWTLYITTTKAKRKKVQHKITNGIKQPKTILAINLWTGELSFILPGELVFTANATVQSKKHKKATCWVKGIINRYLFSNFFPEILPLHLIETHYPGDSNE